MTRGTCERSWQIEACRDGRLVGDAARSAQEHATRCSICRDEALRLDRTIGRLREEPCSPLDEVAMARLRHRVLEAADRELTGRAPAPLHRQVVFGLATTLAIAASASLYFRLHDRHVAAHVELAQVGRAHFTRHQEAHHETVALFDGAIDVRVTAGAAGAVIVHVPDGIIRDEGTAFRVEVQDGRTVHIAVFSGRVSFARTGAGVIHLARGQSWRPAAEPARGDERRAERNAPEAREAPQPEAFPATPTSAHPHHQASSTEQPSQAPAALPTTPNEQQSEDSVYLDAVALQRRGQHAAARRVANEYLERFPRGFRRVEMQSVVDTTPPE